MGLGGGCRWQRCAGRLALPSAGHTQPHIGVCRGVFPAGGITHKAAHPPNKAAPWVAVARPREMLAAFWLRRVCLSTKTHSPRLPKRCPRLPSSLHSSLKPLQNKHPWFSLPPPSHHPNRSPAIPLQFPLRSSPLLPPTPGKSHLGDSISLSQNWHSSLPWIRLPMGALPTARMGAQLPGCSWCPTSDVGISPSTALIWSLLRPHLENKVWNCLLEYSSDIPWGVFISHPSPLGFGLELHLPAQSVRGESTKKERNTHKYLKIYIYSIFLCNV